MKIGAHVSAAGGLHHAPENAAAIGVECFQFFSRPPQGGKASPITEESATLFRETCEKHGFAESYIHAPYFINFASSEARIRKGTVSILRGELDRGSQLGVSGMMFHPGSANGVSEDAALEMVISGMKEVLEGYEGTCRFLVEISAGAGKVIGDAFEEIKTILDGVDDDRVAVCFDTAHAFASGYDLRTEDAVERTMKEFDRLVGKERLFASHCNDSKVDIGARKDRHEHIGKGFIGKSGFEAIIASPYFKNVNLILETPHDEDLAKDIAALKSMRDGE